MASFPSRPRAAADRAAERARPPRVVLRELATWAEYRECLALQKEVWGEGFTGCVPPALLMVCQRVGGVTAGAFGADGRLLGFVFGLTGVEDGRPVHWSDRLAVRPEARDLGLGLRLKLYQRDLLLRRGIETCYWTYDPLIARNAHLNLNRLGAEVLEYARDLYGTDNGSDLHSGLGTDRLVVVWRLRSERVIRVLAGDLDETDFERWREAPVVNARAVGDGARPYHGELPEVEAVRIEVPVDLVALMALDRATAAHWRATTRRAFLAYLHAGYRVCGLVRDPASGRVAYGLAREDGPTPVTLL